MFLVAFTDSPSVLDRDTEYFLAEATRTLNLRHADQPTSDEDALWIGCTNDTRFGPKLNQVRMRLIIVRLAYIFPSPPCYAFMEANTEPPFVWCNR